jgi:uncharacterized protein
VQLEHSFTVPMGIDEAWRILLDIERIGPCMPGAVIESVDGDDFTGSVKVKLGPINLTYKGRASFIEKDEANHRAVIDARGRDARGNGTASAKVTADLSESGSTTTVHVATDLDITGKPAQFGRGVMVDVGNKLIGQFADCLATTLTAGDAQGTADRAAAADAQQDEAVEETPSYSAPTSDGATTAPADEEPTIPDADDLQTPSYGVPGGIPAVDPAVAATGDPGETAAAPNAASAPTAEEPSMNGRPSRPAPQPAADVEPIDLLQSAGPAVAKRLAPVALAGVIVLIALRRRAARRG